MNKHDISWRQHMAFRYATRQSRRDLAINASLILGFILALGVVGGIDYQTEQRLIAEQALESESAYAQVLRDCMAAGVNKEVGGFYFPDTKKAYECKVQQL